MFEKLFGSFFGGQKGSSISSSYSSAIDAYQNIAIPISEIHRRYSAQPLAAQLLRRYLSCSEASTCVNVKSQFLAQYTPYLYSRGDAQASFDGVKRSRYSVKGHRLKHLRSKAAGVSAKYASSGSVYQVTQHPFLSLLSCPNPYETCDVFWAGSFQQREIFGNSYMLVDIDPESGLPSQLRHMYGQHVRIVPSQDNWIEGFEYTINGESELFAPTEVAHFKWGTSPINYLYGSSWLERVGYECDILTKAKAVEIYRFENGNRAEMAFLIPDYNPKQVGELRDEIKRKGTGIRNASNFLILPNTTSVANLSMTAREMEYSQGMDRAARGVRGAAGFPEAMANLNQANLASALQADGQFLQSTIQPLLASHAQQLTSMLQKFYGAEEGEYWFAYDNIVEPNSEENTKRVTTLYGADLLRLNEARAELGYDPVDEDIGDKLLSQIRAANTMTLPGLPQESEALTPVNQPNDMPQLAPSKIGRPVEVPEEEEPDQKASKPTATKTIKLSEVVYGCCSHGEKDAGIDGNQLGFTRKDYVALRNAVKSWLDVSTENGTFSAGNLKQAISAPLRNIVQSGGQDGIGALLEVAGGSELVAASGISWDVLPPEVIDFVDSYSIRLARGLSQRKEAALKEALTTSIENGQNTREQTLNVLQSLKDRTSDEAENIARTEAARAYSQGNLKVWQDCGVEKKRWLLSPQSCPLCEAIAANNNAEVDIGHVFFAQGTSLTVGDKTYQNDYEDVDAPPLHPSCRCATIPVVQ